TTPQVQIDRLKVVLGRSTDSNQGHPGILGGAT
ncbi:MAG: hypothetical protein ACI841_004213, partial [Planctomycetota bacterium]